MSQRQKWIGYFVLKSVISDSLNTNRYIMFVFIHSVAEMQLIQYQDHQHISMA